MRFILLLILVAFNECAATISRMNPPRCPPLTFPNGRIRSRARNKMVRFSCYEGYTLVGNRYSTCIRGRWETPPPVCVNSRCALPPTPEHALMVTKYNGAVAIYFCEPGYVLVGVAEIYCNGKNWNATAPYCRDTGAAAPTSCDFEKPDLCWWEQDPTHDFDWQRHNHDTPSSHIGTGPSHDHTFGAGYEGYYLYIEASGRLVNDTARIVSPLYNATLTEQGCFSFWYHMYGATIGALRVYFKPERSISQLMFEKEGNQGNHWLRGFFHLPTSNTSFQIVIEGIRGASYVSDIAIDDVAILQNEQCGWPEMTSAPEIIPTNEDEIEMVNSLQSCRGRCGNGTSESWVTILPPGSPDACQCDLDCAQASICCPDFAEYCVLGASDKDWSANVSWTSTATSKPIPITLEIDEIDPMTFPIPRTRTIWPSTTRKTTTTTTTTTRRTTTTSTTIRTTTLPASPLIPKKTTKLTITTRPNALPATGETPFPAITKSGQDPTEAGAHVRVEHATIQQLDSSMSLGVNGISGIVVVIVSAIVLSAVIVYVIVRKRKSYKRGAGGSGSALSEDSDVRYLTTDEILDFNLARPSDYGE